MNISEGLMIKLKNYQEDAIKAIEEGFKKHYEYYNRDIQGKTCKLRKAVRQFIEMPTGSGKTITFLYFAKKYNLNTLIIVPSKELMRQVYETSLLFFPKNIISRKGDRFNEKFKQIHICIINSINEKYENDLLYEEYELIIIDECHRAHGSTYKRFLNNYYEFLPPMILGVTATPERLDGKLLNTLFDKCTFKLKIDDMIMSGYLSDIEGYRIKTKIDLSDLDTHNSDYTITELYKKLSTDSRNDLILNLCKNEMKDRKTLIFCINLKHSQEINKLLNDNGLSSAHIDGKMDHVERKTILTAFREGEISYLCNCQLLTEGFDEPSIDGIILARPTRSHSLFMQMIGRGLRLFPKKLNCKIVDIVDIHKNRSRIGFNSIIEQDKDLNEIENFSSHKDIKDHVQREIIQHSEFEIEKANLINFSIIYEKLAVESMINYLNENNIYFTHPITFDDASFLIWYDKLKKEYYGNNREA
jgi:superfamily II DNA or RNA helicase